MKLFFVWGKYSNGHGETDILEGDNRWFADEMLLDLFNDVHFDELIICWFQYVGGFVTYVGLLLQEFGWLK